MSSQDDRPLSKDPKPMGVTADQTRAFSVDIGESCLQGTAEPPVFEAREGDSIVLTATSLYSGALYIHGMEKELKGTPGSEARII
jgi:hypothetical protein